MTPSRALSRELQRLLRERRIPGGACGLFDATGLLLSAIAGVRRAGRPAPVDPRDSWHVGSVTKAITADVCRTLDQRGLMPLETTVADGLSETAWASEASRSPWHAVTVHDLLVHRSGMRANPSYPLMARYVLGGEPVQRTNAAAMRQALTSGVGPAGEYRYSNAGYGVAAAIARARTGRSWHELVEDHYRDAYKVPLGFGRPEWYGPAPWGHRRRLLRAGYAPFRITKRGLDLDIMRPAGDIRMTLEGLAAHGAVHLRRMAAGDDAAYQPVGGPTDPHRGGGYGLGWHVESNASDFGGPLVWHNGSDLFSFALLCLLPAQGVGVVWVTNALQREWHDDNSLVWEPVAHLTRLGREELGR